MGRDATTQRRREPPWLSKTRAIAKATQQLQHKARLSRRELADLEAVQNALLWLGEQPDGRAKAAAMRGTYIDGKPLYLAAEAAGYTLSGIKRTHRRFLTKIAENLGYI